MHESSLKIRQHVRLNRDIKDSTLLLTPRYFLPAGTININSGLPLCLLLLLEKSKKKTKLIIKQNNKIITERIFRVP